MPSIMHCIHPVWVWLFEAMLADDACICVCIQRRNETIQNELDRSRVVPCMYYRLFIIISRSSTYPGFIPLIQISIPDSGKRQRLLLKHRRRSGRNIIIIPDNPRVARRRLLSKRALFAPALQTTHGCLPLASDDRVARV